MRKQEETLAGDVCRIHEFWKNRTTFSKKN